MKKLVKITSITLLSALAGLQPASGQNLKKWNAGVSFGLNRENFHINYHGPANQIPPGSPLKVKSVHAINAGLGVERFLNSRFAITGRASYMIVEMPNEKLFNTNSLDYYTKNERHHWGFAGIGGRIYINPKNKLKAFAEGGVQGDYFVGYKRFHAHYPQVFLHHAEGYRRFIPSAYLTVGAQFGRFELSAEYQTSIAHTFWLDEGKRFNNPLILKRDITRNGISINLRFLIIKASAKKRQPKTDFD